MRATNEFVASLVKPPLKLHATGRWEKYKQVAIEAEKLEPPPPSVPM